MTGEQFREWRKQKDIPAKQAAHEVGISTEHLYRIERGDAKPGGAAQVGLERFMSDHDKTRQDVA